MTTIPPTCPEFTAHPHLVETVFNWKDREGNTTQETRLSGCYQCQCASASEIQGTSQIALALRDLGVNADVHQTGGFTMAVYIETGANSYVYANDEIAIHYLSDDDDEGQDLVSFDDPDSPEVKAQKIKAVMDLKKIHFSKI